MVRPAALLIAIAAALPAAASEGGIDARSLLLASLRAPTTVGAAFTAHVGPAPQRATVTSLDAQQVTLRLDDASVTVPWTDLAAADLHALGVAALGASPQTDALLGEFAFQAGDIDLARADFARVVAAGGKAPADAGRLAARAIEVAHEQRERNAEAAWDRLAPLLDDPRRHDRAVAELARFEAAYDDTRFIIGKRRAIALYRAAADGGGGP